MGSALPVSSPSHTNPNPRPARRVVVFDTPTTVAGQRELAKIMKMGAAEDTRPWGAKVQTCPHPGCTAKGLGDHLWVGRNSLPTDLSKVTEELLQKAARCMTHAGEDARKVEIARKRITAARAEANRKAQAEAAHKARQAEAQARREEAAGKELMESLRRRCRR